MEQVTLLSLLALSKHFPQISILQQKNLQMPKTGPPPPFNGVLIDSFTMSGKLQFDMASKKIKITSVSDLDFVGDEGFAVMQDKGPAIDGASTLPLSLSLGDINVTLSSMVVVDLANSKVYANENMSSSGKGRTPLKRSECGAFAIPSAKSQEVSKYLTTASFSRGAMMANMVLNMMAHTTADGFATFSTAQNTKSSYWEIPGTKSASLVIKTNGVPVSVSITKGKGTAVLAFSEWESSSGDMTAPVTTGTCAIGSMAAHEDSDLGFLGLSGVGELLKVHPLMAEAMSDVSEAISDASEMLYGPRPDDDSSFWTLASVFFISGISGAALVLAFAKMISTRRNYSAPLLADV